MDAERERHDDDSAVDLSDEGVTGEDRDELEGSGEPEAEGADEQRLELEVEITSPSACERHVTVTVPREEIERYFSKAFDELMPTAAVPGFRPGRAPRKLVEHRFRKELAEQVKGSLLMDSMAQVNEEHHMAAISEPDLDVTAIELPDEGPFSFEFNIEVRPDFELPQWKGLTIERPHREFTDADVDEHLSRMLARRGRLVPFDGPAEAADYITADITFKRGDEEVSQAKELSLCLRPTLSFRDGKVQGFDALMRGVRAGETRRAEITIADDAAREELRGQQIAAEFHVLDVKKMQLPELTPEFLDELGGFGSEAELREAVRVGLERQLAYHQQQRARQQITAALLASADWELPPSLLRRQSRRELERSILELRRSGFSEAEILAHENELRQNSLVATSRALKEHFLLERLAEEEKISDEPGDYDDEIRLIAAQSGESPRRVRAQLEKRGLMDILRNQIIERKAIELVLSQANFKDVPFELPRPDDIEAVDVAAAGEEPEIPEAKNPSPPEPLREPTRHV